MQIRPNGSDERKPLGAPVSHESRAPQPKETGAPVSGPGPQARRTDQVTISDEARHLLKAVAGEPTAGGEAPTLSAERRREILDRIGGNWYSQSPARGELLRQLAAVLGQTEASTDH